MHAINTDDAQWCATSHMSARYDAIMATPPDQPTHEENILYLMIELSIERLPANRLDGLPNKIEVARRFQAGKRGREGVLGLIIPSAS